MACSFSLRFAFVEISIVFYFWGGQRLNCKDSESLSLLISLPCCPYDQELWVTTNRMRCQPSHRNKMFTWQVSGNCTFNLYMLYVSYPHFYKLCHITRRLQVFELIFMSEGEGGCWWRGGWTWHLTSNRPLFETAFFFFYKKFFFLAFSWPYWTDSSGDDRECDERGGGVAKPLWIRRMLYQLSYRGAPETVF